MENLIYEAGRSYSKHVENLITDGDAKKVFEYCTIEYNLTKYTDSVHKMKGGRYLDTWKT